MPIYEYKCKTCGEQFEQYRPLSGSDETVKCPRCGANKPERQFSFYSPRNATADSSTYKNT
jgi:putative FmdB family regulatory protein